MTSHPPIWSLNTEEVYVTLNTTAQGLADSEAEVRLKQYGANELPEPPRRSLILRFLDQLTHLKQGCNQKLYSRNLLDCAKFPLILVVA
jgi:magnesium-transporting ATPase (P-type)